MTLDQGNKWFTLVPFSHSCFFFFFIYIFSVILSFCTDRLVDLLVPHVCDTSSSLVLTFFLFRNYTNVRSLLNGVHTPYK